MRVDKEEWLVKQQLEFAKEWKDYVVGNCMEEGDISSYRAYKYKV